MLGESTSCTWTAGARRNVDDAPARSSAFPADPTHPRSNKRVAWLDLSKERAGEQAEREEREWGAGEHAVNPTGTTPLLPPPEQHGARHGLGLLGYSSGCWGVAWVRGEGKGESGVSCGVGRLFPSLSRTKERGERVGGVRIGQQGGGEGDWVGFVWTAGFSQ